MENGETQNFQKLNISSETENEEEITETEDEPESEPESEPEAEPEAEPKAEPEMTDISPHPEETSNSSISTPSLVLIFSILYFLN